MSHEIVIIDEPEQAMLTKDVLESADFGYHCMHLEDISEWKNKLSAKAYRTLLIRKDYPNDSVLRTVKQIKLAHRQMRIIMLAEDLDEQTVLKARESYVDEFCLQDDYAGLINSIEGVIE